MKVTERQRATLLGGENYNEIQIIVMRLGQVKCYYMIPSQVQPSSQ